MTRRRGITLIEVLVSILILSIALVAGASCLSAALISNLRSTRIALATEIAQSTIEEMRSLGQLSTSSHPIVNPQLPGGQVTVTVSDFDAQLSLKRVQVSVTWDGINSHREFVKLETVVCKRAKHTGG